MTTALGQLGLGFLLLYAGGEGLVRGATSLALRVGITPLIVGLTVVAFGTSAPELAVSLNAALLGKDDIAIGNVIGSNIANVGLIVGIGGLLSPMLVRTKLVRIDVPIMLGCTLGVLAMLRDAALSRAEGVLLAAGILAYLAFTGIEARRERGELDGSGTSLPSRTDGLALCIGFVLAGLFALTGGARVFVAGAVTIAESLGVSPGVIGLTVVALGTSLPELATSVIAAMRGQGDLAIGNVVGSNLFNLLAILGITASVHPLSMGSVTWPDLWVMVAFSVVLWFCMIRGGRVVRSEAVALLVAYLGYLGWLARGLGKA